MGLGLNGAGLWDGRGLEMTSVHPSRMPQPAGWGEGRGRVSAEAREAPLPTQRLLPDYSTSGL